MSERPETPAFNLTLEILQGCKYNCIGCMVDKDYEPLIPFDQDTDKILEMVDRLKADGYRTREFTIGPTDVISSRSGAMIFEHRLIKGLAERFDSVVIPLALLSTEGLEELCAKVNVLMKGKSFTLATPFHVKSAFNEKHHALLRRMVKFIQSRLTDVKFELLYLTVNMIGPAIERFDVAHNRQLRDLDFGVRKLVEFVFPHARKGFDNLIHRSAFISDFHQFSDVIQQCKDTDLNRHLIKPADDSYEVTYRDGKMYYTPTLIEKFPIFSQQYELEEPWTVETLEIFKDNLYLDNLIKFAANPVCGSCCHLHRCAQGDVHAIMRSIESEDCLVSMYNNWDAMPCKVPS